MNGENWLSSALLGCQKVMGLFAIQQLVKFLHATLCTNIRGDCKNSKCLCGLHIKVSIHPTSNKFALRNSLLCVNKHFLELVCQPDIKMPLVILTSAVEGSNQQVMLKNEIKQASLHVAWGDSINW